MSSVSGLWTQSERLWNPEITAETTKETFEKVRENLEDQGASADNKAMDTMFDGVIEQASAPNIKTSAIILLIFESLCLYAAYLMWNFEKRGYYLYLAGIAVAFLSPLFLIGSWFGVITAFAAVLPSIFMSIFYAFNLKHMS